jgi:23S rRNA pseudouridine1911/1915/1917 synthase
MPWKEIERIVGPQETGPADRLARLMTQLPHSHVRGLFDHGCVTLNGEPCPFHGTALAAGDRLRLRFEPGRRYREKPRAHEEHAFRLVYEDPHVLVVDKAAGILTVPTERGEPSALVYALARYLSRGKRVGLRVAIVHRLDRDTSGLLVFGKRREVAEALKNQFRDRKPERAYLAIVAGHPRHGQGTLEGYLATDPSLNQYTTPHAERGKLAITHYEVLREVPGASLVRVRLETGRRNQIRVHFAEMGHPVLGDVRYRPELATHPRWKARRLALHAGVLGFVHPEAEQALRFESPMPLEFRSFLGEALAAEIDRLPAPPPLPVSAQRAPAAPHRVRPAPARSGPVRRDGTVPARSAPHAKPGAGGRRRRAASGRHGR